MDGLVVMRIFFWIFIMKQSKIAMLSSMEINQLIRNKTKIQFTIHNSQCTTDDKEFILSIVEGRTEGKFICIMPRYGGRKDAKRINCQ